MPPIRLPTSFIEKTSDWIYPPITQRPCFANEFALKERFSPAKGNCYNAAMPSSRRKEKPRAIPERMTINRERLLADLNAVSRIGIGDRGSVTRLVFSVTELRSRQLLVHLMTQAGLKVHVDRIGNIFGRLETGSGPAVLAGSHLDSVVHG